MPVLASVSPVRRKRKRVWEVDFLRGVCILLMIVDHAMYNFFMLIPDLAANWNTVQNTFFEHMAQFSAWYWVWNVRTVIRFTVVFIFLFLSGVSCSFTRSNGHRLRKLSMAAALVTLVTFTADGIADVGLSIAFGILHILAFSLLLYIIAKKLLPHRNFYLIIGAVITLAGFFLPVYGTTIPFWSAEMPHYFTLNAEVFSKILLGTATFGSDCYGILPYTGFFFLGAAAGEVFYPQKRSLFPKLDKRWHAAYSFVGRKAIWVYLTHQIAIVAVLILSAMAVGYHILGDDATQKILLKGISLGVLLAVISGLYIWRRFPKKR